MNRVVLLITICVFILLVILGAIFYFFNRSSQPQPPSSLPSPTPFVITPIPTTTTAPFIKVSPLEKTVPGSTSESTIQNMTGLVGSTILTNNEKKYSFASPIPNKTNDITTQNGVVIFEKELTPVKSTAEGYTTFEQITSSFGNPDEIIKGSKRYGWNISTYIYASKGFAVVGNTDTDEVFEIQTFIPTTVGSYTVNFGTDLNPNATPPLEGAP